MRHAGGITCATLLVIATSMVARPASAAPAAGSRLALTVGLAGNYDSNLLQYSDDQIRLFEGGTRPDEFSIRTRDDLGWNPYVTLGWEQRRGPGRRRSVRLHADGNFHAMNGTADTRSMSVGWRESFRGGRRLLLSYYRLPDYYLRQLFDPNAIVAYRGLSKYRRAQFTLQTGTAMWTQRIRPGLMGSLDYHYEDRRYNPEFEERSSGTNQYEGQLALDRLPRRGSVSASGGYRVSHARAGDFIVAATGAVTPLSDVSYHGLVSHLEASVEVARGRRWRLAATARYELETRDFTSTRPTDRFHFGRKDMLNAGELDLRLGVGRHWTVLGNGRTEFNLARLGNVPSTSPTGDSGSYRDHQAGLALEWNGDVWHGGRAQAAEEEP